MPLQPGTTLGPYTVTAKLGAGGMGEVYRARDTKLDRDVALKVLPDAFTSDPDRLARFEREAKVLASLNHPNIGHIYGLEEAEGTKALVLGFIFTASILVLSYAGSLHAQQVEAPPRLSDGLEVATPGSVGLRGPPLASLREAVVRGSFPNTTSVLIAKDGRLVFEEYLGDGSREHLNDTRSAMKSVTALAIGAAVADGTLESVNESAFQWLSDLAPFEHEGPLKQGITIADFLTMSSALDCDDGEPSSPGNEENMYPLDNWSRWAADLPVKRGYRRNPAGRGPFSYCTAGSFLLGQILQRALGESVDDYIDRRLFGPLGITVHEWYRSPSGEVMTGGGLRLRSRDLIKLGLLVLSNGRWEGDQVIPASWISEMLTVRHEVDADLSYGFLFWRRAYESPCGRLTGWFMSGNGGNVVVIIPSESVVAVVTRRHYNEPDMHRQTLALLEDHILGGLTC